MEENEKNDKKELNL
jgi:hypothetical protein